MGYAKYITSEAKSGLPPEEIAVLELKIKNLIEQIAEANSERLDVKTEMALKNKLISLQQKEKLSGVIKSGSELYDRYNGGERTETLLNDLEDYSRRLQEEKNEIWGSMEIAERKSKDIERKPTNKKRKRLNNKKHPKDSLLKGPTELAADIADSQPATFKRGGQEFYTEASQPEDAREEAQRQKTLAFLSEKNNSEDKNQEEIEVKKLLGPEKLGILEKFGKEVGDKVGQEPLVQPEAAPAAAETEAAEEKKEAPPEEKEKEDVSSDKPSAEVPEKKPEKTAEEFLKEARQSYVDVLLAKERAQKDVEKLSGWRRFFQGAKETKERPAAEEEFKKAQENFERVKGDYDKVLLEYAASLFKKKEAELADKPEKEQELKEYAKTEIFNEYFLKETERINQVRQENLPPSQKKWYRDCLYKFSRMPKAARWAVSAGVATGVAFSFGTVAATGAAGIGAYYVIRLGRAALGALAGSLTDKVLGKHIEKGKAKTEEEIKAGVAEKIEAAKGFEEIMKIYSEQSPAVLDKLEAQRKKEHRQHIIKAIAVVGAAGGTAAGLGFLENYLAAHHYLEGAGLMKGEGLGLSPERKPVVVPPVSETTAGGPVAPEDQLDVRGQGITPESAGPESMPKVSGVVEAQKGDSVWKMLDRQLEARYGDKFTNLDAARKTYIIDALKDKVAVNPEKFGLSDVDKIKVGGQYDFGDLFEDSKGVEKAFALADDLKDWQMKNILHNNQVLEDWVKSHSSEKLTSAKIDELLSQGKISPASPAVEEKMYRDGISRIPLDDVKGAGQTARLEDIFSANEQINLKSLGFEPAEYKAIQEVKVGELLKQIPADNQKAWTIFGGFSNMTEEQLKIAGLEGNERINLPHDGIYGAGEFSRHLKLADFIRSFDPGKGIKEMTIKQFLGTFGPKADILF